jgi:hypothetical protein
VYWNDFAGGQPNFYSLPQGPVLAVQPVRIQALVVVHRDLHEGASVLAVGQEN